MDDASKALSGRKKSRSKKKQWEACKRARASAYRKYLREQGWAEADVEEEVTRFIEAGCPRGRRGTEYKPVTRGKNLDIVAPQKTLLLKEPSKDEAPKPPALKDLPDIDIHLDPEEEAVIKAGLLVTDRDLYVRSIGFDPYLWQEKVLHSASKRKVVLGARQGGKSTIVSSIPCHTAKYYPGSLNLIFAPTQDQSRDDMDKIKHFIAQDRSYPPLKRDASDIVELANGSRIQVVTASDASSRGKSHPRCIVIDEASRVEDVVYMSAIRPMLNSNPDCELVLISTPYGQNGFFYRACTDPREKDIWERFMVVSPFVPDAEGFDLLDIRTSTGKTGRTIYEERRDEARKLGVKELYISPRSDHYDEQQENLVAMGPLLYEQEFDCEFVEKEGSAFTYSQIDSMKGGEELFNPLFPDLGDVGEVDWEEGA